MQLAMRRGNVHKWAILKFKERSEEKSVFIVMPLPPTTPRHFEANGERIKEIISIFSAFLLYTLAGGLGSVFSFAFLRKTAPRISPTSVYSVSSLFFWCWFIVAKNNNTHIHNYNFRPIKSFVGNFRLFYAILYVGFVTSRKKNGNI